MCFCRFYVAHYNDNQLFHYTCILRSISVHNCAQAYLNSFISILVSGILLTGIGRYTTICKNKCIGMWCNLRQTKQQRHHDDEQSARQLFNKVR